MNGTPFPVINYDQPQAHSDSESGNGNGSSSSRRALREARLGCDTLESRELMAYSSLGFSRPDLVVTGYAAPAASYGGTVSLVIDVQNLGATSIVDPLGYYDSRSNADPVNAPRYTATADATPSTVQVYISTQPTFNANTAIPVGEISVPLIRQNQLVRLITPTLGNPNVTVRGRADLPPNTIIPNSSNSINTVPEITIPDLANLPARFPNSGTVFLFFEVDSKKVVAEHDETNNIQRQGIPVNIVPSGPDFAAVGFDITRGLQPADLVQPNLKIINYGTADNPGPDPLEVSLVASTDTKLSNNDAEFARYEVASVKGINKAPTRRVYPGLRNLDDPANVTTVLASNTNPVTPPGPRIRIPNSLNGYHVGVVVDIQNKVAELSETTANAPLKFSQLRQVGAPLRGLSPANFIANPATRPLTFPNRQLPS